MLNWTGCHKLQERAEQSFMACVEGWQKSFKKLKTKLPTAPVLTYADFSICFTLEVSHEGLEAVLLQEQGGKLFIVVAHCWGVVSVLDLLFMLFMCKDFFSFRLKGEIIYWIQNCYQNYIETISSTEDSHRYVCWWENKEEEKPPKSRESPFTAQLRGALLSLRGRIYVKA